jgi:hypothetical protein
MKIIKTIISIIIFANLISYSQEVPFGNVSRLRKIQETPVSSSILSYKTNLLIIPYNSGNDVLELSGEKFVKSFKSNFGTISISDTLNDIPFILSDDKSLSFKIENQPWKKIVLIEYINDYQITKDKVYFIGYNQSELQRYLIRTSDFVIFERIKIPFFSDSDPRIFRINESIYISSKNRLVYDIYKLNDFNSFTKVETKLNNIIDGIQFKDKFIYRSSDEQMICLTDLVLGQSKSIGFAAVDDYNFIAGSDLVFICYNNQVYYSYDGNNWSSFTVENINSFQRGFLKSIVFHDKHIFLVGDKFDVYKIGPIISSKGLSVESELIHAVKITGNIGQQVEILASDELNGEYKPLTYFTLPSTEFIYNDNRTNKAKQYYKVK